MAVKFFTWLKGYFGTPTEISCHELLECMSELALRELAFRTCVNIVASAIGKCEIKTFRNWKEIREAEYYLWNVEPNVNQNSTEFWHKVVDQLYSTNEALIVNTRKRVGGDALVCADAFMNGPQYPSRQNEYTGVIVGDFNYDKTFYEKDVIHLVLNGKGVKDLIDKMADGYSKLADLRQKSISWQNGRHWKVHVSQRARGGENWETNFQKMLDAQFKPFLNSDGALLPEFDGYKYEQVGDSKKEDVNSLLSVTEEIFNETAKGFLIPIVLINGKVENTADANQRFLTNVIDPLCDQITEEVIRKRYGYEEWQQGNYAVCDSSTIIHYDLLGAAANIEKLIGSGCFTINDVRRAMGQTEINEPWANAHYMTLNIAGVEEQTQAIGTGKE